MDLPSRITARELEVLNLLSKGMSYKGIAAELKVSRETVKMHLKHIYRKLEASNKIEALNKAFSAKDPLS